MSARTNARAAAARAVPNHQTAAGMTGADAAFDSVLASLDTPEMREAARTAITEAFAAGAIQATADAANAVLAAVRAELTKETP